GGRRSTREACANLRTKCGKNGIEGSAPREMSRLACGCTSQHETGSELAPRKSVHSHIDSYSQCEVFRWQKQSRGTRGGRAIGLRRTASWARRFRSLPRLPT